MKKIISLSFVILVLFTTVASPIYAKDDSLLPPWFVNAIKPFQDSLISLFQRINSHEARIAELEKKVDFNLPDQWGVSFYEDRFTMNTPHTHSSPGTISLPLPNPSNNNCRWNNAVIDSDASARAIAHLSTGDIYGVGTCREILFKVNDIPSSGTTFEADIYIWWQGTEKHTKQNITVPDRPFPTWGSLLISPSNNGLSIQATGTLGIGTTSPGISISNPPDSDLLKINN